jgi:molybdopterin molybdotransferase
MISYAEARAIVAATAPLGSEPCALEAAEGCTLAERIVARDDLVPFARSAMDGFAVRAADTQAAPVRLRIADSVYAEAGTHTHTERTATAIATGGAIPAGADAVIPIEDVIASDGTIAVIHPVHAGHHIFPAGEDARAGDELAARGMLVDAPLLALLAAAGITALRVYRRPRIAVVTTGNELVPFDATPAHGQVRDSNGLLIAAAARAFGAASVELVSVSDDRAALTAALDGALTRADLTIVTGGASVGERDFVKAVCAEIGVTFAFTAVALRPARPTGFGRRDAAAIAVLPGNPASAFVALHEFVRPVIAGLAGRTDGVPVRITAELDGTLHSRGGRALAAYARIRYDATDRFIATPLANQCSALTRLAADADGFIIVPADAADLMPGDRVAVDIVTWRRVYASAAECFSHGVQSASSKRS